MLAGACAGAAAASTSAASPTTTTMVSTSTAAANVGAAPWRYPHSRSFVSHGAAFGSNRTGFARSRRRGGGGDGGRGLFHAARAVSSSSNSSLELARIRQSLDASLLDSSSEAVAVAARDALSHLEWKPLPHHLSKEALWRAIRKEAKRDADDEPALASFLYSTILVHSSLEKSMSFLLANKLASPTLLGVHLMRLINDAYDQCPEILDACVSDMQAVFDRDPACDKYTQCMLNYKGFHAIQCQRVAHWMWASNRKSLAMAIHSRVSEAFHVDIHPAARLGQGVMVDHATGVVIGETAIVGDNVSMLHHVTLGGSGVGRGLRHPIIGNGVLLGAGVSVLGPITVGYGTKVGAGSVVVTSLPPQCVAVGVPSRIVKRNVTREPCLEMDQCRDFILDYVI